MTEDIEFWRNKARELEADLASRDAVEDQLIKERGELEAERDAIRAKTFKECLALIPGGTHCDPQEIADAIRGLAQTDEGLAKDD